MLNNMKGIEYILKDGTKESYDPIDDNTITEDSEKYTLKIGMYTYVINKTEIDSIREYECCDKCGFEMDMCMCDFYKNNR